MSNVLTKLTAAALLAGFLAACASPAMTPPPPGPGYYDPIVRKG